MYRYNHDIVLVLVVFAVTRAKCATNVPSETSRETMQRQEPSSSSSRTSEIWQTLNTFNTLNDVQAACEQLHRPSDPAAGTENLYCNELIKVEGPAAGYAPLKRVMASEMNRIRAKLTTLLALEKKAVACKGMRHLLPIVMYGIFVDSLFRGTEIGGSADVLADLYATVEADGSDNNYYNEEPPRRPVWRAGAAAEERSAADVDGDPPERNAVDHETRVGFAEKIKNLVRMVRLFARDLRSFDDGAVNDAIVEWPTATTSAESYRQRLLFAFRAINGSYRAECFPGYVDTAALLAANRPSDERNRKIRLLVEAADRVFETALDDFAVLCVKFFPVIRPDAPVDGSRTDVPMLYYHVFNKYRDRDVRSLIGDEIVVEGSITVTLNGVAPRDEREINATAERLARSARNTVKCRCMLYVNLMTKLYANAVRALLANERGVRRLRSGGRPNEGPPRTEDELRTVFQWYHDRMKEFRADGLRHDFGDPADDRRGPDQDDDNDDDNDHAFYVYAKYHVWSIGEAVDAVAYRLDFLGDTAFETELTAMLSDMEDAVRRHRGKSKGKTAVVTTLAKWRERGERAYRDNCFAGDYRADPAVLATLNDDMRRVLRPDDETAPVTLDWMIATIDDLNRRLADDLRPSGRFKF